ncbi:MAG: hypothetical protein ACYTAF_05470 [Planctomycetota bacterium]|jgi:hypothetical protein
MRTGLILSAVAILNLVVCVPALNADVIPTRIESAEDQAACAKVEARLVELGVDPSEAKAQVDTLPDGTVAYFAQSPESLQVVSGLEGEELMLGLLFLAVVFTAAAVIAQMAS